MSAPRVPLAALLFASIAAVPHHPAHRPAVPTPTVERSAAREGCGRHEARSGPRGRLTFTRLAGTALEADTSSSPGALWADVDGDGDRDLLVLNGYASLASEPEPQADRLYLNRGGELNEASDHTLVRTPAFSGSAVWGDYDGDGDGDLFLARQRGADNALFRNEGEGRFTRITEGPVVSDGGRSFSAAWVDVDGDGWLDLHVLNGRDGDGGEADFLYRNEGSGTFSRVRDVPPVTDTLPSGGAVWGDYDRDGDPDAFVPVYSGEPNRLYRNEGGWRFTEVAGSVGLVPDPLPSSPPASVARWLDHDADGDLDLFVGTTRGTVDFLYENDGEGRFRRTEAGRLGLDATYVSDATWADLDNDADRDLVIAVWGGAAEIYRNDGTGRLRPGRVEGFGREIVFASSVSAADPDGDGDLDLLLTQWPIDEAGGAPNLLYRNEGPVGAWLVVELEGRDSNRSGIGARIAVTAEVGGELCRQVRRIASRTSWRSSGGLSAHFGLGDARRVERIEVAWPSGRVDTLAGPLEVNRRLRIVEGAEGGAHPVR